MLPIIIPIEINNIAINSFSVNLDVNKNNLNIGDNKLNEKNIEEMDVESEIINYKFPKIEEEKYIVQGITSIDDKLLISAYTKEEDDNNKRLNSKVYIYPYVHFSIITRYGSQDMEAI